MNREEKQTLNRIDRKLKKVIDQLYKEYEENGESKIIDKAIADLLGAKSDLQLLV